MAQVAALQGIRALGAGVEEGRARVAALEEVAQVVEGVFSAAGVVREGVAVPLEEVAPVLAFFDVAERRDGGADAAFFGGGEGVEEEDRAGGGDGGGCVAVWWLACCYKWCV